jgi:site-specific recombinase XerD
VNTCRNRHFARKTAKAYRAWIRDYLLFHRRRMGRFVHPRDVRGSDVEAFLTYLAVERRVAAATQNQALNAVVFLYKQVLEMDLDDFQATRAKRSRNVPTGADAGRDRFAPGQMRPP